MRVGQAMLLHEDAEHLLHLHGRKRVRCSVPEEEGFCLCH